MQMKDIKKNFARFLRRDQTDHERIAWELLRDRRFMGLKFRRQHVIEGFVVDFFCHQLSLGIELDGGIHKKQKDYDALRQEIIEAKGITILRIPNSMIENDEKEFLKRIQLFIKRTYPLSPLGEGTSKIKYSERKNQG